MKYRRFAILLFLALIILCGCSSQKEPTGTYTLWVVTEESCSDGMNYQAKLIVERMEEEYEGLTVKLDILPTNEAEREIVLKQLRTKVMAGNGPDVYLLPTGNTLMLDHPTTGNLRKISTVQVEPLFLDAVQAMQNGLFADLQTYYAADDLLGIDALNETIMDAGVVSGRRYILPLRYDIPIIMTDGDKWEQYGITDELMNSEITTVVSHFLDIDSDLSAAFELPTDLSLLPELFDYNKEEIKIAPQSISSYMRIYQEWKTTSSDSKADFLERAINAHLSLIELEPLREYLTPSTRDSFQSHADLTPLRSYFGSNIHWSTMGLPAYSGHYVDMLENQGVERLALLVEKREHELPLYPMRATDGSIIASITYWSAVGSSCENPEIAYAFLRQFLEEEFQWGEYRPRVKKSMTKYLKEVQAPGQVENSWPVRTVGSASALWDIIQYQNHSITSSFYEMATYLSRQVQIMEFTDEDLPALNREIDEVRFPITLTGEDSMEYALSLLNEADGTPTDVDIDALAEKVWQNLWWHLAEG